MTSGTPFGSLAINAVSIVAVQHYIGHADVDPIMRYVHYKSRAGEAAGKLVAAGVERTGRNWRPSLGACMQKVMGSSPIIRS